MLNLLLRAENVVLLHPFILNSGILQLYNKAL